MFKRRRQVDDGSDDTQDPGAPPADPGDAGSAAAELAGAQPAAAQPAKAAPLQGPWDVADAPADDEDLIDLGGLRVPAIEGFDINLTTDEGAPDVPIMVTYSTVDGAMQIHAFAAPRSAGIWAEVRQEIVESLREAGGNAEEAEGPFGTELRAAIPAPMPDGSAGLAPARFIGVDGPRWFLRALLSGPVVEDPARGQVFEAVLRRIVVVRGGEAMAPRDIIPLRLPPQATQSPEAEPQRPGMPVPERGPEITEVR